VALVVVEMEVEEENLAGEIFDQEGTE